MKKSRELGMQTFDQALFDLYEAGADHATRTRCATPTRSTTCASKIKLQGKEAKNRNMFSGIEQPRHRPRGAISSSLTRSQGAKCGSDVVFRRMRV